jgi:hypothetical protein
MLFKEQAESCRRQANQYAGRPEAPFLLRIASVFDELATVDSSRTAPTHRRKTAKPASSIHA